jgi:hypothetical protein
MMKWIDCGRKRSWPNLMYYPDIFPEGVKKTNKHLTQDSRSPDQDLNAGPTEYGNRSDKV